MGDWAVIDRVTICGDGEYHHVFALDIPSSETIGNNIVPEGRIVAKTTNLGKQRLYLPRTDTPDFDEVGKYLVASSGSGAGRDIWCNEKIAETKDYSKTGVKTRRYTAGSD